jgi:hypothetical protein
LAQSGTCRCQQRHRRQQQQQIHKRTSAYSTAAGLGVLNWSSEQELAHAAATLAVKPETCTSCLEAAAAGAASEANHLQDYAHAQVCRLISHSAPFYESTGAAACARG